MQQKNAISISSGITADLIRRSPDKNTSEVLKRVSGASIQYNKFVVVRGLSDRYNSAQINGAILPSSEPDKKAFSFHRMTMTDFENLHGHLEHHAKIQFLLWSAAYISDSIRIYKMR